MAFTRTTVRTEAKALVQDNSSVPLLRTDPGDYNECVDQAVRTFSDHKPNERIVHQVLAATGFRQQLFGVGAMSGLTGLDAWLDGYSNLTQVYYPYNVANQDDSPLDPNHYKLVRDPGPKVFLHFLSITPVAAQTLRLEFTNPHTLHESDAAQSTVRAGDQDAFVLLVGHFICLMAAVRFAQNTGNTNLPSDIVDRRTQSDIMKSRAKDLWDKYAAAVGLGTNSEIKPHSAFGDLDVTTSHNRGFMWHPTGNR
jgi:hypothetical protein